MGKLDLQALSLQDISLAIAIEEHKTVSRAAEQLRISQSSASYGLEKLRRAFNDPIFLRRGSQMVMTERGKALVHYAQSALPQLEALTEPATFDPKRDKRHFCIAATGYEISSFFATTHKKLREVAPHISIQIEDVDAQTL